MILQLLLVKTTPSDLRAINLWTQFYFSLLYFKFMRAVSNLTPLILISYMVVSDLLLLLIRSIVFIILPFIESINCCGIAGR